MFFWKVFSVTAENLEKIVLYKLPRRLAATPLQNLKGIRKTGCFRYHNIVLNIKYG